MSLPHFALILPSSCFQPITMASTTERDPACVHRAAGFLVRQPIQFPRRLDGGLICLCHYLPVIAFATLLEDWLRLSRRLVVDRSKLSERQTDDPLAIGHFDFECIGRLGVTIAIAGSADPALTFRRLTEPANWALPCQHRANDDAYQSTIFSPVTWAAIAFAKSS